MARRRRFNIAAWAKKHPRAARAGRRKAARARAMMKTGSSAIVRRAHGVRLVEFLREIWNKIQDHERRISALEGRR